MSRTVDPHVPGGHGQQPDDAPAERALAAARLADQAEHLARGHGEADAVDRADRAEVLDQVDHLERGGHPGVPRRRAGRPSDVRCGQCRRREQRMPAADRMPGRAAARARAARCGTRRRRGRTGRRTCRPPASALRVGTRPGISRSPPSAWRAGLGTASSRPWVYGWLWLANSASVRRLLDDAAGVHDHDPVGDVGDHAQVVGDEQDRRADLDAQVAQHVQDAGLDGDVQRGGGLVGDEQLRSAGDRHGDHDALPHAAGELVRVLAHAPGRAAGCRPCRAVRWPAG